MDDGFILHISSIRLTLICISKPLRLAFFEDRSSSYPHPFWELFISSFCPASLVLHWSWVKSTFSSCLGSIVSAPCHLPYSLAYGGPHWLLHPLPYHSLLHHSRLLWYWLGWSTCLTHHFGSRSNSTLVHLRFFPSLVIDQLQGLGLWPHFFLLTSSWRRMPMSTPSLGHHSTWGWLVGWSSHWLTGNWCHSTLGLPKQRSHLFTLGT